MYVCMYVCMYIYIYTYIHRRSWRLGERNAGIVLALLAVVLTCGAATVAGLRLPGVEAFAPQRSLINIKMTQIILNQLRLP